jgi:hypothetical protein
MSDQLSWSLSDEVAPYFVSSYIKDLCALIDEKATKGLKYQDLKQQLLNVIYPYAENKGTLPELESIIYNRAYEFAKYY